MFSRSIKPPLILLSCSYALAGAHKRSDSASFPFLCHCPFRCSLHFHRHGRAHRAFLSARVLQLSALCSDPARCRCHCRSRSWTSPNPNHQARAACGRCSTPCCFSCPCPRCLQRLPPTECLFVLRVLLLGGGCRWVCWDRHWFGGLFGCRVCL